MLPINDLVVHWYGIITLHAFHLFVNARFFFFFFLKNKKGDSRVAAIVPCLAISWVSPWVPLAWTGARKLRTYTRPRLYWFLELPEIAITVLMRTQTWYVVKSQQLPTSCTRHAGGFYAWNSDSFWFNKLMKNGFLLPIWVKDKFGM